MHASSSPARRGSRDRIWAVAATLCAQATAMAMACGGTTGREGLTIPEVDDASASEGGDAATPDATMTYDSGAFDVVILYADRILPDVSPPPDTGTGEAGYPWPSCPPFLPIGGDGGPTTLGNELDQIPTVDGGAPAPDGSACATYPWLGSTATDECVTSSGGASPDFIVLPPCSWCQDAGFATGGTRANTSRLSLCYELYACIMSSGCGANGIQTCLCGSDLSTCTTDASGPCADLELAALEYDPSQIVQAIKNYTDPVDTTGGGLADFSGYCAGALNQVFQIATSYDCVDAGAE